MDMPKLNSDFNRPLRGARRFGAFVAVMVFLGWAAGLATLGTAAYVAWHFLAKVW